MDADKLWMNFWEFVRDHPAGGYLFRGQADASPIRPKIGRTEYNFDPTREKALVAAFERAARPYFSDRLTNFELLALAQHHGAPTRLVDWSSTPLVAAYFAVSSYPCDKDAKLYALDVTRPDIGTIDAKSGMTDSELTLSDPLQLKTGVYLIETAQVSMRIQNQRGIFTLHGSPTENFVVPDEHVFTIRAGLRHEFQERLMDLGIDAAHIYPDINGLCASLDWRFRFGKRLSAFA